MLKIFLIAFVALAAIVLLKRIKPEFALLLKFAVLLLLGFLVFSEVSDAVSEIFSFGERVSIDSEMLKILLKALGLCLVAQIASDVCKDCGESYHVNFLGGKTSCDRCGGELYQRKDDNEETVGNRLKVYNEQTAPLIKYYTEKGVLLNVDGEGTIDEVFARICDALRK